MNFLLSPEQLARHEALVTLLARECAPRRVHEIIEGPAGFDQALWDRLIEFGLPALAAPEAYGGLGLEMIDVALAAEALGAAAAPAPFLGHALATIAIARGGSDAQRERWLPALASGEVLASVALGEAGSRWLPEEWRLEEAAVLDGEKRRAPNAEEASLLVVGLSGGGLGLVAGKAGVKTRRVDSVDRTRPLDLVTFNAASVELLAQAGDAARVLVDAAAILLAADAFGGAEQCLKMTTEYAKLRQQFGAPIGSFQAVKHQLANMALEVEPARGLYWYAAYAFDAAPDKASHAAAQAKAHVCDVYLQSARDAVELHGGIGFTWEHDAHIYLKRAMFDWAWLGQPSRHRLRAAQLSRW